MRILAIGAAVIAAGLLAWFLGFLRYNRRRARARLDRVRISWRGKVLGLRWQGATLHAGLQFRSHSMCTAHLVFRLRPRPLPWEWLLAWFRAEPETLTIESDLATPPAFSLAVRNHPWSGRVGNRKGPKQGWQVHRPGPILLTTQDQCDWEHSQILNALLTARHSEFAEVRLQPESPHLAAELPLDALEDFSAATQVLETLQELAAGARAPKH